MDDAGGTGEDKSIWAERAEDARGLNYVVKSGAAM
jgi:hypothetical protein